MGTALKKVSEIPGWYIEFQAAVLRQLPRPGEIDSFIGVAWSDNQASLGRALREAMVPPIKMETGTSASSMVNPAEFFVTSDQLYIHPDFVVHIELSPCPDDMREMSYLYSLPLDVGSQCLTVSSNKRKNPTVYEEYTSLAQFMRNLKLALESKPSPFEKGDYLTICLRDNAGLMYPVDIYWGPDGRLSVVPYKKADYPGESRHVYGSRLF